MYILDAESSGNLDTINNMFGGIIDKFFNTFKIDYTYGVPILLVLVLAIAILIAVLVIKKILFKGSGIQRYDESKIIGNREENMKDFIYKEYIKILKYKSDGDIDNLSKCADPTIVSDYVNKLNKLKMNNYKRVMSDFNLVYCSISYVHKEEDNEFIEAVLTIELKDYIINSDNQVISGSKDNLVREVFSLLFSRDTTCPRCGGEIDFDYSMCLYCRSKLTIDDYYSVLKKEKILK